MNLHLNYIKYACGFTECQGQFTECQGQLLLEGWESYQPGTDFIGMGQVLRSFSRSLLIVMQVNKYFNKAHNHLWPSVLDYLARPEFQVFVIFLCSQIVAVDGDKLGGFSRESASCE